jgi:hypothetical protein
MPKVHKILIKRLTEVWNPWEALRIEKLSHNQAWLREVEPLRVYRDDLRGPAYHKRRIRFFLERIRAREELEPICVANYSPKYPLPCVDDGNHRLIACILTHQKYVAATYEGRLDVLRYLEGRRAGFPRVEFDAVAA